MAVTMTARVVTGAVPALIVGAQVVAMAPSSEGGGGKEDAVHNGKSPAGLEHGAGLESLPVKGATRDVAADIVCPDSTGGGVVALGVADVAQVVDGGDEGADNGNVDEGDEEGVGGRAVVAEEGEDGPGEGEDGDDEEDEDGVGGQEVALDKLVDEPGEHAHCAELESGEMRVS